MFGKIYKAINKLNMTHKQFNFYCILNENLENIKNNIAQGKLPYEGYSTGIGHSHLFHH